MRLMGRPLPEPYIPLLMIPVFFALFFIPAACEEVGWMGYAVDPLQDRWSALTTGLILGSVWALWHVVPWLEANNLVWVAGQCLSTIGLRILIVWLYNNTGKSVFAAIVFHDMSNVSEFLFPNYGSYYNPVISGAITAVIVVIVTFLWGTRTLARFRFGSPQASQGDGSLI
jgi:membrane protease YdiL (CAAX protease family)